MATKKKQRNEYTEEELQNPRTPEAFRLALRRKTRIFYDIQELRLQTQGRLTKKAPNSQIELHPRDKRILEARLTDLQKVEDSALMDLDEQLHEVPFYAKVIEPERKERFRGLGPRMASVIVSSFDIHREDTVSKMWAFAGLAPLPADRCKKCFVVVGPGDDAHLDGFKHPKPQGNKCEYAGKFVHKDFVVASGKQMRPVAGEKLKYNAWLRTKLVGVLAGVLLKCGSPYKKYYDEYKHRWQVANKGTSDAHRHQAAMRYMIKMLLLDIWKEWRAFEGLPVRPSYAEEKLGHVTSQPSIKEIIARKNDPTPAPLPGLLDMEIAAALEDEPFDDMETGT